MRERNHPSHWARRVALVIVVIPLLGPAACSDDGPGPPLDAGPDAALVDAGLDAGGPDAARELVMPAFDMTAVMADLEYLSSDDTGGRAPATPGNEAALAYVEARFAEIGLEPAGDEPGSYRQEFPYTMFEHLSPPSVSFDGTPLVSGEDYTVVWFSGSGQVTGEVVYVGYGTAVPPYDPAQYPNCWADPVLGHDDYAGLDVTDKIVLVMGFPLDPVCPFEFNLDRHEGARSRGAMGMMTFFPVGYHSWYPIRGLGLPPAGMATALPWVLMGYDRLVQLVPDLPDWLAEFEQTVVPQSRALGVDATIDLDTRSVQTVSHNLLGRIPGDDVMIGHETVIVSGHIDGLGTDEETGAVYNGTTDNLSGTVAAYRIAEQIMTRIGTPRRSVLVAAWNAEERGLIGSCHYVNNPLHSLFYTAGMVNIEHLTQGDGGSLFGYGLNDNATLWILQVLVAALDRLELPISVTGIPMYYDSDHACFRAEGLPAMTVSQGPGGVFEFYHSVYDDFDRVEADEYRKGLEGVFALVGALALGLEHELLN